MSSSIRPSEPAIPQVVICRIHCRIGLSLLALALAILAFADLSAYGDYVPLALDSLLVKQWSRDRGPQNAVIRTFGDHELQMLLDDIPNAIYDARSVIFLGGSNVQEGLMLWKLPPAKRSLFHNYGINSVTFLDEYQLLRYLVEHRRLSASGGNNPLVVFGLYFGNAVVKPAPSTVVEYLPSVAAATGLYSWDRDGGLRRRPVSEPERILRTEWARARSFFYYAGRLWNLIHASPVVARHAPTAYREFWSTFMSEPVQASTTRRPNEVFAEMLDYLHSNRVQVRAVLIPMGSWFDEFEIAQSFRGDMVRLCAAKQVPLTDLSHLLADEDFMDSSHYNYAGQVKFQTAMLSLLGTSFNR